MTFFVANDSIQAPKMPEQNKAKKGEKFKAKKLGRAFANLALAKAQVKNKRSSNFRHKKDIRQARNSKTQ